MSHHPARLIGSVAQRRLRWIFAVMLAMLASGRAFAESAKLEPARVFTDHMVLQQQQPIWVWGTAEAGHAVRVQFAGHEASAVADALGRWGAQLPAMASSSDPRRMIISSGDDAITLDDVLVGEVWIAAGQSNMEFPLRASTHGRDAITHADRPQLRLLHFVPAADGGGGAYTARQLSQLTPQRYFHGQWQRSSAKSGSDFSAVAYHFALELREKLLVPVGVIELAVGGSPTEAWIREGAMRDDPTLRGLVAGDWMTNAALEPWCQQRAKENLARAHDAGIDAPHDALGLNHPFKPGFCWAAGVEPIVPMSIRGVIWYQGESNAESVTRAAQEDALLRRLIADWRVRWNQPSLPFYFVQLPALKRPNWPAFREVQRRAAASIDHCGMAITIDTGEPNNVHPHLKQPVGKRLARLALANVYHHDLIASGPLPTAARRIGSSVRVDFRDVGDGLITNDNQPARWFELAGPNGVFHPAVATLAHDHAQLTSDAVAHPVRVRYAWVPYPSPPVNLVNSAKLPASPFELTVQTGS